MAILIIIIVVVIGIVALINAATRSAFVAELKPIINDCLQQGMSQETITVILARDATRQVGRVLQANELSKIRDIVTRVAGSAASPQSSANPEDIANYLAQNVSSIMLHDKEKVIAMIPCVGLREPRSIRVSRSTYGGPSVRVAKGVYLRGGKSVSHSESHEELRDIDGGDLIISNQRLVFTGPKKTVDAPFKKIVSIEPLSNSIILHKSGRERAQYFEWPDNLLNIKSIGVEKQFITGSYLKDMIEAQANS